MSQPEPQKVKEPATASVNRRRAKAGTAAALLLLALSLISAYPLLRAESAGVKVALSVAGQSSEARRIAVGGPLYRTTTGAGSFLPPESTLHLLTLAQAFGSVGSRVRYNLYPRRVEVKEFGLPFEPGSVLTGHFIMIYIPAAALNSRKNAAALSGIEAAMVRSYGLVRLFGERFAGTDGSGGAYGALYRVEGSGSGVGQKTGMRTRSRKERGVRG